MDRVASSYASDAKSQLQAIQVEYEARLAEAGNRERTATERATDAERTAAEEIRRLAMLSEGRARTWARWAAMGLKAVTFVLVIGGAIAAVASHTFHGWIGLTTGLAIGAFVTLELAGVLGHLSRLCATFETKLTRRCRAWLEGKR